MHCLWGLHRGDVPKSIIATVSQLSRLSPSVVQPLKCLQREFTGHRELCCLGLHTLSSLRGANAVKTYSVYDYVLSQSMHRKFHTLSEKQRCKQNRHWCNNNVCLHRNIFTSPAFAFWERDDKGGYNREKKKVSRKQLVKDGLKELRGELSKWQDEVKEKLRDDPLYILPGDKRKIFVLDNEESLEQWVVTSDQDHKEGYSSGSLTMSPTGHGLFSGNISLKVPKDGITKRSGYCNMRTMRPRKSFKRDSYYDWSMYTHLEMRVRGDGRSYLINISTAGYFDITWNDVYSYVLYTRGGPHWQFTRIPFSKFFLSSKGRVQDKQRPVPLERISHFGISAGDRVNASFRLEIDYVGVYSDPHHTEEFAYEMYKLPKLYIY